MNRGQLLKQRPQHSPVNEWAWVPGNSSFCAAADCFEQNTVKCNSLTPARSICLLNDGGGGGRQPHISKICSLQWDCELRSPSSPQAISQPLPLSLPPLLPSSASPTLPLLASRISPLALWFISHFISAHQLWESFRVGGQESGSDLQVRITWLPAMSGSVDAQ